MGIFRSNHKPLFPALTLRIPIIVGLFVVLIASRSTAQEFRYIELGGFRHSLQSLSTTYSNRWTQSNAYGLEIRTPYYVGEIGLSATFFDLDPTDDQYDRFNVVNLEALYGIQLIRIGDFYIKPLIGVGIQRTERININTGNNDERELMFVGNLEAGYELGFLHLYGRIGYNRVFNYIRQDNVYAGAGIRIRMNLSESVRKYIR